MNGFHERLSQELCGLISVFFARGFLEKKQRARVEELQRILGRRVIRFVPADELMPPELVEYSEVVNA